MGEDFFDRVKFIVWLVFQEKTPWVANKWTDMVLVVRSREGFVVCDVCECFSLFGSIIDGIVFLLVYMFRDLYKCDSGMNWGENAKSEMDALGKWICGEGVQKRVEWRKRVWKEKNLPLGGNWVR